jgi:hypothetical protein
MARKDEKVAGVYIIRDAVSKMAYIGKSKGLGAIVRSAESKLKTRRFANETLQEDWIRYEGKGFEFIKLPLPEGRELKEYHQSIIQSYEGNEEFNDEEMEYMLYNNITYVDKVDTKEISELSHLTSYERRFVKLVIEKLNKIDIDAMSENLSNL